MDTETTQMASSSRMFIAGIGTTLLLVGAGFGGGLMLANTALDTTQSRGEAEPVNPVRVILPTTAQAAEPIQMAVARVPEQTRPTEVAVPLQQTEKVDTRKVEAEVRGRKRRYAERKARKIAAAQARQQLEQPQQRNGLMAFGDDNEPRVTNFFGN
jgi:hypothetical protein